MRPSPEPPLYSGTRTGEPSHESDATDSSWIAIGPLSRQAPAVDTHLPSEPPTFGESQFDIILRRQRVRPIGGLKVPAIPSRFLNLSSDFEFAGWGSISNIKLNADDGLFGKEVVSRAKRGKVLGQFTASALAGNAVLGSVFYALPAVVVVSGVYSPISLFVAAFTLFLWRPIMEELADALPVSGAPYTYILNVSTKSFALVSATLLLLDYGSTAVVSAATAAAYLSGEVTLPFPAYVGAILVLVILTSISLCGIKESSRIALAVLTLHMGTMLILIIVSAVHWGKMGNSQLKENWRAGQAPDASAVALQVFYGFCLGALGLTGFECTPAYIARIKPGRFPLVLRNLHYPAIFLNATAMLLVIALVPLATILDGANVLSALAEVSAGKWLRIWTVVDAIVVLCCAVLTGILSACELLEQLAHDRVVPSIFLKVMPSTGSPYLSVLLIAGFSGAIYASAAASLSIVSKMFTLVWLAVMSLFPLSLLFLKFNRGRLARDSRTSLSVIIGALAIAAVVFAGNIAVDPTTAGYFAAYFIGILALFSATQNKIHLLRWAYWIYDQSSVLHTLSWTKTWGGGLIRIMTRLKRQPVCILAKTDEINHLLHMILYVRDNEGTSCLKIVHFTQEGQTVPSELEANSKILDEAFPEITIDLVVVNGPFTPVNVAALAHRLQIPRSLMFMSCPGRDFPHVVSDFGTRIVSL